MKMKLSRDRIMGLFSVLLGVIVCLLCTDIPKSRISGDVGSKVFPLIAAFLLIFCGALLALQRSNPNESAFLLPFQWARLGLMFLIYILYTVTLYVVGFLPSTPVFVFIVCTVLAKVAEKKSPVWARILFSLILTGFVYFLFQVVLKVRLPAGILF